MQSTELRGPRPRLAPLALAISAATAGMLYADFALAQELEEIVVTARFREENLQEIPLSISALSADMLAANGATSVIDVSDWAPNVVIDQLGSVWGPTLAATVRGLGYGDFKATSEPTMTIYVDDVVLGRPTGAILDLLDLERVEVLRGPQGTLFGKNAIGGVMRLISRRPGDHFASLAWLCTKSHAFALVAMLASVHPVARAISLFEGRLGSRIFAAVSTPATGSPPASSRPIWTSTLA